MATKLEIKGNFLFITEGSDSPERFISRITSYGFNSTQTELLIRQPEGSNQVTFKYKVSDLVDSEGNPYSKLEDVETFLNENLGFSGAGASAALKTASSGYSSTGAFAGKPISNNFVWQNGSGINYSQTDVDNGVFKVFSLDEAVHLAVDNPYWTTPTPTGTTGIGLFEGEHLPEGVTSLLDYSYNFDTNYPLSSGTGFEGSIGRIKLNDLQYGDQLRVRFDYNVIPQIANTTVEPALWYSNRDGSDNITFTFPLTTQPSFYGSGTVGNTYLNRSEVSAWIVSSEDVNALTLPAIKSDNPVIIQPLSMLITIIR